MKNTCPKCDTPYNVSASVVGRKFTCKNCNTPVVVTAEGLDYQNPPAKAAPPPATVAAAPEAAFDFDAGGGEEEEDRKPAKAAKSAKPAKRATRDEEPEEEEEDRPIRPAKRRASGGGGDMGEYLAFRKFLAPVVIKTIFWMLVVAIAGGGVIFAVISAVAGGVQGVLIGGGIVFIGVPLYILMVRIYCELILLAFNIYDRLGDIKTLLEKSNPPPPTP